MNSRKTLLKILNYSMHFNLLSENSSRPSVAVQVSLLEPRPHLVRLLFCMLFGARYANAVTNVKVAAYGRVDCDAAKSVFPFRT